MKCNNCEGCEDYLDCLDNGYTKMEADTGEMLPIDRMWQCEACREWFDVEGDHEFVDYDNGTRWCKECAEW